MALVAVTAGFLVSPNPWVRNMPTVDPRCWRSSRPTARTRRFRVERRVRKRRVGQRSSATAAGTTRVGRRTLGQQRLGQQRLGQQRLGQQRSGNSGWDTAGGATDARQRQVGHRRSGNSGGGATAGQAAAVGATAARATAAGRQRRLGQQRRVGNAARATAAGGNGGSGNGGSGSDGSGNGGWGGGSGDGGWWATAGPGTRVQATARGNGGWGGGGWGQTTARVTARVTATPRWWIPRGCQYPAQILNLKNWKLTLPTGSAGSPKEIVQPAWTRSPARRGSSPPPCAAVAFRSRSTAHHEGFELPRSELREMDEAVPTLLVVVLRHTHHDGNRGVQQAAAGQTPTGRGADPRDSDDISVFRLERLELLITERQQPALQAGDPATTPWYQVPARYVVRVARCRPTTTATGGHAVKSFSNAYFKPAPIRRQLREGLACDSGNYGETMIYDLQVSHDGGGRGERRPEVGEYSPAPPGGECLPQSKTGPSAEAWSAPFSALGVSGSSANQGRPLPRSLFGSHAAPLALVATTSLTSGLINHDRFSGPDVKLFVLDHAPCADGEDETTVAVPGSRCCRDAERRRMAQTRPQLMVRSSTGAGIRAWRAGPGTRRPQDVVSPLHHRRG